MAYINKNISLNLLQDIIKDNILQKESYLPQSFMIQQKKL